MSWRPQVLGIVNIKLLRGEEIFSSGAESSPEGTKKFLPPLKEFFPWGITENKGAEYLIRTEERLVLVSSP